MIEHECELLAGCCRDIDRIVTLFQYRIIGKINFQAFLLMISSNEVLYRKMDNVKENFDIKPFSFDSITPYDYLFCKNTGKVTNRLICPEELDRCCGTIDREKVLNKSISIILHQRVFEKYSHCVTEMYRVESVRNSDYKVYLLCFIDENLIKSNPFQILYNWFVNTIQKREYSIYKGAFTNIKPDIIDEPFNYIYDTTVSSQLTIFPHVSLFDSVAATYYEKEEANGIIQFINKKTSKEKIEVLFEIDERRWNSKAVRKLLVAAKNAVLIVDDLLRIVGIASGIIGDKRIAYTIRVYGHMSWGFYIGEEEQFRRVNASYFLCYSSFEGINEVLGKWFDDYDKRYKQILSKLSYRKGAVVIITNEASKEAKRLCDHSRGTKVTPFCILDKWEIIDGLTQIDGAIILDEKGYCHAIGIILDGTAEIDGDSTRGARYNSTLNYIYVKNLNAENHIHYVGIVVSEDKMVDIFEPYTQ